MGALLISITLTLEEMPFVLGLSYMEVPIHSSEKKTKKSIRRAVSIARWLHRLNNNKVLSLWLVVIPILDLGQSHYYEFTCKHHQSGLQ